MLWQGPHIFWQAVNLISRNKKEPLLHSWACVCQLEQVNHAAKRFSFWIQLTMLFEAVESRWRSCQRAAAEILLWLGSGWWCCCFSYRRIERVDLVGHIVDPLGSSMSHIILRAGFPAPMYYIRMGKLELIVRQDLILNAGKSCVDPRTITCSRGHRAVNEGFPFNVISASALSQRE